MQQDNNPFGDMISDCNKIKEGIEKIASEDNDVKEGRCTKEDQMKEPGYLLFSQISDSVVQILSDERVISSLTNMVNFMGNDKDSKLEISKSFIETISVIMTNASYQAVLFYNDMLKEELTKQLDHMVDGLNTTRADVKGISMAIDVFKKRINDIEKTLKISEINSKLNN